MKKLGKSVRCALRGVEVCVRRERSFRLQPTAAGYAVLLALLMGLDAARLALLTLTIAAVLSAEAMNTAIEAVVDLASPEPHPLAKAAKDAAAGAVLILALGSVAVAVHLFGAPKDWETVRLIIGSNGRFGLLFLASAIGAALFARGPREKPAVKGEREK